MILIDTSVLCAYYNSRDVHHKRAVEIIEDVVSKKYGKAIITDYIFDELVTVAMRKIGKPLSIEIGGYLLNSEILIFKINNIVFDKSWKLFKEEQNFSFTDSTTVVFMETFSIKKIATFDKEFKKIKNIEVID